MAAAQCVQMNAFQLQQLAQHAQQQQHQANSQSQQNISLNSSASQHSASRPIIERGASWSYNETRILLSLWGQDMVQRQLTNSKRTRHVWEKIAERIREHGFERTAGKSRVVLVLFCLLADSLVFFFLSTTCLFRHIICILLIHCN